MVGRRGVVGAGKTARQHPRHTPADRLQLGLDGRAGIFSLQLAELPLAGQHPQRVGDLGAQTGTQVVGAGQRLEGAAMS